MNILLLYDTIEGQTGKISRHINERLGNAGYNVQIVNTSDEDLEVSFDEVDKVILAAPVHERRHPRSFEGTVTAYCEDLAAHDTLMISVSLKAAFESGLEEAQEYLSEMEMRTGFAPTQEALVAGAVRRDSYDYFESQVLRHVLLADQDVNLADGDREFTDWVALDATVDEFLENDA